MISFPGILSAILFLMSFYTYDLDDVRSHYNRLASDKTLCERTISELKQTKNISATNLAYWGAAQTIWANHVISPINKLKTFKEGTKNIEQAIKNEPNNAELRFIRLSVQKNAPPFLGYKSNIKEDVEFIKQKRHQINSEIVQDNIDTLL